jgi:hypothetical protein
VQVIEFDSWRTKDAKEAREEARDAGRIPLLEKDYERVELAVSSIRAQIMARDDEIPLFSDGKPEQMLVWEERGVWCRALVDWLRDDLIVIDDLKTTARSANPVLWATARSGRSAPTSSTPSTAAASRRSPRPSRSSGSCSPRRRRRSQSESCRSTRPPSSSANAKVDRAIERWRHCMETNDWPGYPQSVYYAETPAWAELQFLELDGEAMTS